MSLKNKLWTEKFRPKTVNDYVFVDEQQQQQVKQWISNRNLPNILFSGEPGTGKTSLAKVLINELGINEFDVLEINASRENKVEVVREKIMGFVETIPFGDMKVVLLDESDFLSAASQATLRHDMEAYSSSVRFILTCNYSHRVIPALKSRCHEFHIAKPDIVEFTTRAATVLVNENIEFDLEVLDTYVRSTYPDLRKCLNQLQVNSQNGTLTAPHTVGNSEDDILLTAVDHFKNNRILEGRQQLLHYIGLYPTRIEQVYRWLYNNLELWGDSQEKRDASIIIIRNGLANLSLVGIPEISLAATMCELTSN